MMASNKGRGQRREHVYRRPKDKAGLRFRGSHHCPECGKWCYYTEADAKLAVKQAHPGATVHYYTCESYGTLWWHYTAMEAWQVEALRRQQAAEAEQYEADTDWFPYDWGQDPERPGEVA